MDSTRWMQRGARRSDGSSTSNLDSSSNTGVMMRVLFRPSPLLMVLPFVLAASASAQTASAPTKIGYINSAMLLQQAPGRAEAEAQFDKEVVVYRHHDRKRR